MSAARSAAPFGALPQVPHPAVVLRVPDALTDDAAQELDRALAAARRSGTRVVAAQLPVAGLSRAAFRRLITLLVRGSAGRRFDVLGLTERGVAAVSTR